MAGDEDEGGQGGGTGGGAGGAGGAGGGAGGGEEVVSRDVYRRVVTAKQGLETQVAELQSKVAELSEKTASVDTLMGEVEKYKTEAEQANTRFERFKTISSELGTTDPDAIEAVEWRYGKLEGDERPSIGDWLGQLKQEPDKAPTVLRPFLTQEPPQQPPKQAPKPRGGNGEPAGGGATVTNAQLSAAREKATSTGDWSDYRALRNAMGIG